MNKIRKYIFISILFILILISIVIHFRVEASNKLDGIENFPSSYQAYLKELAKKHPNWKFRALYRRSCRWDKIISR